MRWWVNHYSSKQGYSVLVEDLYGGGNAGRYGRNGFLYVDPGSTIVELGGSESMSPRVTLERLDAHKLTLDYGDGWTDGGKRSSVQWLFEGDKWKCVTPKKDNIPVVRLDKSG